VLLLDYLVYVIRVQRWLCVSCVSHRCADKRVAQGVQAADRPLIKLAASRSQQPIAAV